VWDEGFSAQALIEEAAQNQREARQKEQSGKKLMPENEADSVAAIFRRIDEIKEELRDEVVEKILEEQQSQSAARTRNR